MEDEKELTELIRLVSSHGTERQCYAVSVAFWAALHLLQQDKELFAKEFGTDGAQIINDFHARE